MIKENEVIDLGAKIAEKMLGGLAIQKEQVNKQIEFLNNQLKEMEVMEYALKKLLNKE